VLWIFPSVDAPDELKTEQDASAQTLHQGLTFARYNEVSPRRKERCPARDGHSRTRLVICSSRRPSVMLLALPAAYALAIRRTKLA